MISSISSNLQPFVSRLAAHTSLSAEYLQALLQLPTRTVQVAANRDVVRLGENVDHCCLILEGLAARFDQGDDGERQFSAFHIAGDMADLHSLVLPNPTSGIQALTTSTLVMVPHDALRGLARASTAVAEAFWRECSIDAAILAEWVVNVGRRDARTRIAHLLCEMAVRYGRAAAGAPTCTYVLPVTQTHLADATALTPVHVNRTLKALREYGLVAVRSQQVNVLDWEGLKEAGEFEGDYLGAVPVVPTISTKPTLRIRRSH